MSMRNVQASRRVKSAKKNLLYSILERHQEWVLVGPLCVLLMPIYSTIDAGYWKRVAARTAAKMLLK